MKVVIRTDSSAQIGSGHLMRCLTLANMLKREGAEVSFVCRDHLGNFASLVKAQGYTLILLPVSDTATAELDENDQYARWLGATWEEDARRTIEYCKAEHNCDWLIVDHYGLDRQWESAIRPFAGQIMVIDDLANRPHDCDLLLDQNLYDSPETRYESLVPEYFNLRNLLLGPRYALLREEFYKVRGSIVPRTGEVKRVFVFFGGADVTNETTKALRAIKECNASDLTVDVVVGSANTFKDDIDTLASTMPNVKVYGQVNNMAQLMGNADLAIGGGGTTTWERCFLGLPTLAVILADNQREMIEVGAKRGALINLGWYDTVTVENIRNCLARICDAPDETVKISRKAEGIMSTGVSYGSNPVIENLFKEAVC